MGTDADAAGLADEDKPKARLRLYIGGTVKAKLDHTIAP